MPSKKPVNTLWTKNLQDSKEIEEFESLLRNSRFTLGRLSVLLKERLEEISRQERSSDQYNVASWAALQAHRNGAYSEIRKVLDLLSFLEEN